MSTLIAETQCGKWGLAGPLWLKALQGVAVIMLVMITALLAQELFRVAILNEFRPFEHADNFIMSNRAIYVSSLSLDIILGITLTLFVLRSHKPLINTMSPLVYVAWLYFSGNVL